MCLQLLRQSCRRAAAGADKLSEGLHGQTDASSVSTLWLFRVSEEEEVWSLTAAALPHPPFVASGFV